MSDDDPQMSSWNGGITQRQLRWLQHELAAADVAGERVLVASHHQLGHGAARATHMAWNWREVQQVGGARQQDPVFRQERQARRACQCAVHRCPKVHRASMGCTGR